MDRRRRPVLPGLDVCDVLGGSLTFADIADTLKDDSFAEAVAEDSRLDITVTVLAVSGSDEPVGDDGNPVDVVEPKEEDEEETKKKGGNTDAASSGVIIGVAAGGAVLAIVLGFVAYRCGLCGFSGKKAANMGEDANEPTVEMQKIFPDRSPLSKGGDPVVNLDADPEDEEFRRGTTF